MKAFLSLCKLKNFPIKKYPYLPHQLKIGLGDSNYNIFNGGFKLEIDMKH